MILGRLLAYFLASLNIRSKSEKDQYFFWGHSSGDTELCLLAGTASWTVLTGTKIYTPDLWGLYLETVLMGTHG